MSQYIPLQRAGKKQYLNSSDIPVLLDFRICPIKHRIFSEYYKFHKIVIDSFEIQNNKLKSVVYPVYPSGCSMFIFFIGREFKGKIVGSYTSIFNVTIPCKTTMYVVRMKPGALHFFFPFAINEFTDRAVPIQELKIESKKLCQQIRFAESFHERNVMFQRYLEILHAQDFDMEEKLKVCLQLGFKHKGIIKVNDIAKTVACSTRYINRLFLSIIGVSPKVFFQLLQLQYSLKKILELRPKSIMEIALDSGYFDQAHMNRSYQKYLNCTAFAVKKINAKDISNQEILLDANYAKASVCDLYKLRF